MLKDHTWYFCISRLTFRNPRYKFQKKKKKHERQSKKDIRPIISAQFLILRFAFPFQWSVGLSLSLTHAHLSLSLSEFPYLFVAKKDVVNSQLTSHAVLAADHRERDQIFAQIKKKGENGTEKIVDYSILWKFNVFSHKLAL